MVEKVNEVWAANDGKLFQSEREAVQHEAAEVLDTGLYCVSELKRMHVDGFFNGYKIESVIDCGDAVKRQQTAFAIIEYLNTNGLKIVAMTEEERRMNPARSTRCRY